MTITHYARCAAVGCIETADKYLANAIPICPVHEELARVELLAPDSVMASARSLSTAARATEPFPVVYYIWRPDQRSVKIGASTNVRQRFKAVRRGPAHLYAIEPGGHRLEASRHREFQTMRTEGTEWFRCTPVLVEHMNALRVAHGEPYCPCPLDIGNLAV